MFASVIWRVRRSSVSRARARGARTPLFDLSMAAIGLVSNFSVILNGRGDKVRFESIGKGGGLERNLHAAEHSFQCFSLVPPCSSRAVPTGDHCVDFKARRA